MSEIEELLRARIRAAERLLTEWTIRYPDSELSEKTLALVNEKPH